MFNPFKKKESFQLDDYSLPSLSENTENNASNDPFGNTLPQQNDPLSNINPNEQNMMGQNNGLDMNQNADLNINAGGNSTSMGNLPNPIRSNNTGFDSSPFSDNEIKQNPVIPQQQNTNNDGIHNDIAKAKLDALEAKTTLIDARLSSIEQKLELLNRLILEEVSDETKKKIKVRSIMDSIKE